MGGLSSFVGNLTGGIIGTSDAEKASRTANVISEKAKKEILTELDSSWGDISGWMTPYLNGGATALNKFKSNIGLQPDAPVFDEFNFNFSDYQNSPAYKFMMDQGTQAVDRIAASSRSLNSGNRMTAMADYTTGLASREYGNEFARQLQTFGANRDTTAMQYDADMQGFNNKMGNYGYIANTGINMANNMSSLRQNLSQMRNSAYSNRASEATAAALIPAQEKMSFVNNLISSGSTYAGFSAMGGG